MSRPHSNNIMSLAMIFITLMNLHQSKNCSSETKSPISIALMNFCHIDFHHFEWISSDELSWLQQILIKENKSHHSDEFQLHLWALLNWSIFSRVRTFHQTLQGWIFITLMNFHHNNEVSSKYFHYSDELSSHRLVFITYFIIH